jgi:hypothetical protein
MVICFGRRSACPTTANCSSGGSGIAGQALRLPSFHNWKKQYEKDADFWLQQSYSQDIMIKSPERVRVVKKLQFVRL